MSRRTLIRCLIFGFLLLPAGSLAAPQNTPSSAAERRVLAYIRSHVKPGQPLLVTDLYNRVFTKPDERQALNKLYQAFFRIPLFVAEYQSKFGRPPKLAEIAQQFDLENPRAADTLLRVMESDPRVPQFITRDPKTGEITHVDVEAIRANPRFGQAVERQLGGWEGKPSPAFSLDGINGGAVSSQTLSGKLVLLYVWFTGCPPCMKEAPALVALDKEFESQGLEIVGANADQVLGLTYDDATRRSYIEKERINFPIVRWTRESDSAFGNVSVFPTLFLIGRNGIIIGHWVGYVTLETLRHAVHAALKKPSEGKS